MTTVALTSLGCSRNLVDSEIMLGTLKNEGFIISGIDDNPDILIINTCSFIQSAREESVNAILEAAELKKRSRIRHLVVCGCLPQLYGEGLRKKLKAVDAVIGTNDFNRITDHLKKLESGKSAQAVSRRVDYVYDGRSPRLLLTPPHYAYVKISEGCNNRCSYCIIPRLRGKFRSRTIKSVMGEAERISSDGRLREIDLIGQDTTLFGIDIYKRPMLARLIKETASLKNGVHWTRLLYTHPAHYTDSLIEVIKDEPRVCKYLDLPIQHVNDRILKAMKRRVTKKNIITLIEKLRRNIPGLTLRTSIIVGFPGERDSDFEELLHFVRETRFERLGAFVYSRENETPAYRLKGQLPEKVKNERLDRLMRLQQTITLNINNSLIGKELDVLIDERVEDQSDKFLGRTEGDAPEVDNSVYVSGKNLSAGEFRRVRITGAMEYDLVGEAI